MQSYADDLQLYNSSRGLGADAATLGCGVVPPSPDGVLLTAAQREAAARATLAQIAEDQRTNLFSTRFQSALETVDREFSNYLLYHAVDDRNTWETASDLEVLVFVKAHWLPRHLGRQSTVPATSTLSTMLSCLKRAFRARNRSGFYDGGTQSNPVDSQAVEDFKTTFAKQNQRAGRHETSAVPLPASVFKAIMDQLDADLTAAAVGPAWSVCNKTVLLLARDAAAFSLLWHSSRRAQDVLHVEWPKVWSDRDGTPVRELWRGSVGAAQPSELYIVPISTKTETTSRPQTWVVRRLPTGLERYCAVACLQRLFQLALAAGVPEFSSASVFVGFSARTPGAISSTALAHRLKDVLAKLSDPVRRGAGGRNYSLHSFRRGALQHAAALGVAEPQLMSMAGMRSFDTLQRYLDVGRHLRC